MVCTASACFNRAIFFSSDKLHLMEEPDRIGDVQPVLKFLELARYEDNERENKVLHARGRC